MRRAILYEEFSNSEPIWGLFLLSNFQIDSALTFSSGLTYEKEKWHMEGIYYPMQKIRFIIIVHSYIQNMSKDN